MRRVSSILSILILFLCSLLTCQASWWWPFKKKAPRYEPPEVHQTGKYITPVQVDPSKTIHEKRTHEDPVSIEKLEELAKKGNTNAQLTLGKIYFDGSAGVKQNYHKAFRYFEEAAKNGNPQAMYNVAICYDGGFGVRKASIEKCLELYRRAAEAGVPEAQLKSAVFAEAQGKPELAFRYYKMLADAGDTPCKLQVALFLLNGYGVEANPEQAVQYLLEAAQDGNTRAQIQLADCYQQGVGVQPDYQQVASWLTLAAHEGDPEAQAKLGTCYERGLGVNQNAEMAFYWYKISAEAKYATGQYLLGNCYHDGYGTSVNLPLAFENYTLAAEAGDTMAQLALARAYQRGEGTQMDPNQAIRWLTRAADSGLPIAQARLGSLLFIGTDTIPANPARAQQLLDEAVASDDPIAIIQVALCYLNGEGVAINRPRASALLQRAANLGSSEAIELQKTFFPD